MPYTVQRYYAMFYLYELFNGNPHEAAAEYANRFPDRQNQQRHRTFVRLSDRLIQTGQIAKQIRDGIGAHPNGRNTNRDDRILQEIAIDRISSCRLISRNLNISKSYVHRTLKADNLYQFYLTKVQHLEPGDNASRVQF